MILPAIGYFYYSHLLIYFSAMHFCTSQLNSEQEKLDNEPLNNMSSLVLDQSDISNMPRRKRQLPKCSQCGRITMTGSCSHCLRNAEMENDDAFEISIIPQSPEVAQTMKDLCPDDVTSSSCFRISTSHYPLQFVTTQTQSLTRRWHATSLNSDTVSLCQLCNDYLNPSGTRFQRNPSFKCLARSFLEIIV